MSKKLAVIILDGLDTRNMRQMNFPRLQELYRKRNHNVLGCSTLPHTAVSNPMIWGGVNNMDKLWVKDPPQNWADPARGFSRKKGGSTEESEGLWRRKDFETAFIWDILDQHGYDASAIEIPFVLPPYSFNTLESYSMGDHWFPEIGKNMKKHIRELPEIIENHSEEKDFIAASIQMPDKWLHGLHYEGTPEVDSQFISRESRLLDQKIASLLRSLENKGFDWMIFGDHGSWCAGRSKVYEIGQMIPRHLKESIIISNLEDLPDYSSEIYPFMLEYFDVEEIGFQQLELEPEEETEEEEVKQKLEKLGYR